MHYGCGVKYYKAPGFQREYAFNIKMFFDSVIVYPGYARIGEKGYMSEAIQHFAITAPPYGITIRKDWIVLKCDYVQQQIIMAYKTGAEKLEYKPGIFYELPLWILNVDWMGNITIQDKRVFL